GWTSSPVWTLDGSWIVFSSVFSGAGGSLWRISPSGTAKPQRLAGFGESGVQPAISRDGHHLAYKRFLWGGGGNDIWRVEIPGHPNKAKSPTSFISSTRDDFTAKYSPDGKKIAFASDRSGTYEIWVCDRDGSNAIQLTSLGAFSLDPHWSPDSQHVVFDST